LRKPSAQIQSTPVAPGVVFDCNIYLQAAVRAHGPSFACLATAEAGVVRLFLSAGVLGEVSEVLKREKTRRKFPVLTLSRVDLFLRHIISIGSLVENVPAVFLYPRDPKDEAYLNLAIAAGADYLVSRDKDLLDLVRPDSPEGRSLLQIAQNLQILDPVTFLRQIVAKQGVITDQ